MGSPSIKTKRLGLVFVVVLGLACKKSDDESKPAACDIEKLRATTTTMAQLPPAQRGTEALVGVELACESSLPEAFVAYFEAENPGTLEHKRNPAKDNGELEPLIRAACRDWDTLRAVMNDAPADQRAVASFHACEAERYDVIAQDQVNGFASTEVNWALHQWLLDHGVELELAKPLTLAMLAYEREQTSPVREQSELVLPNAVGSPLHEGVAVYVSREAVRSDYESIVRLEDGHAVADALRKAPTGMLTAAMIEAGIDAPSGPLVAADAQIPFATMLDLLDFVSAAGRNLVELAVTSPEHGITLLPLKIPPPEAEYVPAMTVEITGDGQISVRSAAVVIPVAMTRDDPAAFLRFAETVEKTSPSADTVIISAAPEVPLQQVVDVIAAVRGSDCQIDPCKLPFAVLSRTPAHEHHLAGEDPWDGLVGVDVGKSEAKVEDGKAEVTGSLDRDIIRRIVRAHINEVVSCHEKGLREDPSLTGRVEINFVITGKGKVASAVVQESTLKDSSVAKCIAKAVKSWTFPKPTGGGNVVVTYPFELSGE